MQYTSNYGLSQYEATDRVTRTAFNSDNAKLDAALKSAADAAANAQTTADSAAGAAASAARLVFGTYTGNGLYGPDNPNRIQLGFQPRALLVYGRGETNSDIIMMFAPHVQARTYAGTINNVTWLSDGVEWFNRNAYQSQFNYSNHSYSYIAIP